jgi:hypothetical protein
MLGEQCQGQVRLATEGVGPGEAGYKGVGLVAEEGEGWGWLHGGRACEAGDHQCQCILSELHCCWC